MSPAGSGNNNSQFKNHYGGSGNEEGNVIIQASDGNYVAAGYTTSYGSGSEDVYLLKVNQYGIKLWEKSFGGANVDIAHDLIETADKGYLLLGETKSFSPVMGIEAYFIKTDKNGNMIWQKTVGGANNDEAKKIVACSDHSGYVWVGWTEGSLVDLFADVYIGKLNEGGDTLWSRRYNLGWTEDGISIVTDQTGNFYLLGNSTNQNGDKNLFVMKTDAQGDSVWTRFVGGVDETEEAGAIAMSDDGNLVICGTSYQISAWENDILAVKMDTSGNIIWQKQYGNSIDDHGSSVIQSSSGDLIFAGSSIALTGNKEILLVKTDQGGTLESLNNIGSATNENGAYSLIENGNSWIMTGFYTIDANNSDLYIVKIPRQ